MIEVTDLAKTYRTSLLEVQALGGVSIRVSRGEIYGIVGFSGAGKSTLLRCINRLEEADSGSIRFDGLELSRLDRRSLSGVRRRMGMIFQHFNLLDSRNVAGNIAYPLELAGLKSREIKTRVEDLLTLVGLEDKAGVFPGQLSGGQKQRVGIARALANQPEVLLCDEATSALDPLTTFSTLELLKKLNRNLGLTLVLVTHELDIVRSFCDRVAVLDRGLVAEEGSVAQVFGDPRSTVTQSLVGINRAFHEGTLFAEGAGV